MTVYRDELLNRFLKYVRIYTPSDEECEKTPSSDCQFDLAEVLEKEMKEMGLSNVYTDEHCYVYGQIPASPGSEKAPSIGFIAHIDTVSDFCQHPVNPIIHENYDGKDIYLEAGNRTVSTKDFPHLKEMAGRTVITSDGTTILGADDKSGVAQILTAAGVLLNSGIPHGKVSICFTPDEEIGGGAKYLDLKRFGADFAYTVDGDLEGSVEYETFNAAGAQITVTGVNVHPGSAKDIMINSAAVACEFQSMLPQKEQPAFTEGYEGFYHLIKIQGAVDKTVMQYIIRDHDRNRFESRKKLISETADALNLKYGEGTVKAEIKDTYYNMAEVLKDHMHIVENARRAIEMTGLDPKTNPVRGGTDGAQLSFRGLPCPNLGTGGEGFHGPFEHISLEGMELCVQIILNIIKIYAENI